MERHPPPENATGPATPQIRDVAGILKIKVEQNLLLSIELLSIRLLNYNREGKVDVKAYADRGYGHGERDGSADGIFFAVVDVKSRDHFERAEVKLVTYLAILQEYHRRTGKGSKDVRGFYTDGYRYRFMAIEADKEVISSPVYNIHFPRDAEIIFNHVYAVLEAALLFHSDDTDHSGAEGDEDSENSEDSEDSEDSEGGESSEASEPDDHEDER